MASRVECPKCRHDVAEVGFTTHAVQTETWMRIGGHLMRIATTLRASEAAHCNCGELLPMKALEVMRQM